MNLKYLETFLMVAEVRSFTEAGQRLGLTQSAVSLQLQKLERDLGARLVDRSRQPATLTAAGEALLREGAPVARDVRRAREAVQAASGQVAGVLALCASTIPGEYVLPGILVSFCERYPEVIPQMLVTDSAGVFSLLSSSQATFGFAGTRRDDLGLTFEALVEDEVVVVGSRQMAQAVASGADARAFPLLSREEGSGTQAIALEALGRPVFSPRMVLGSTQAVLEGVRLGAGVAFVSRCAAAWWLGQGELAEVPLPGLPLRRTLWMAYDPARVTGALRTAFLGHVRLSSSGGGKPAREGSLV